MVKKKNAPKSGSQAVRDLVAEGVTETAEIISEAKKRWGMVLSKSTVYNAKASGKTKSPKKKVAKRKAKPKPKAKATPKGSDTKVAIKALKRVVDSQGIEKTREMLDIMEALQ